MVLSIASNREVSFEETRACVARRVSALGERYGFYSSGVCLECRGVPGGRRRAAMLRLLRKLEGGR